VAMVSLATPFSMVLNFALPRRCAGCGCILRGDASFCTSCWQELRFFTGLGCRLCNTPMANEEQICGPCMARPPQHDGVAAAVRYGNISSDIAIRLKHGRRVGLAKVMAQAMARHVVCKNSVLVPVPLHRRRIWNRGFNQSALIARHLSGMTGVQFEIGILERIKHTPKLGSLGPRDREKALQGAIKVPRSKRLTVRDRDIYLVDDVYTSGATANACAKALKRAGAQKVKIICWARALKDEDDGN
jgi:ComF family protein